MNCVLRCVKIHTHQALSDWWLLANAGSQGQWSQFTELLMCKYIPSTYMCIRSYSKRVVDIPNVGFYSLPKIMGRTGRFIYDGLRLISLGCKQKQKNTNIVQKPNTALVAVGHFPLSPYRLPVGSSANKSLHWGYR